MSVNKTTLKTPNIEPQLPVTFYHDETCFFNKTKRLVNAEYTVIGNGPHYALIFGNIPLIAAIDVFTKNAGDGKLFLNTHEGSYLIDSISPEVMNQIHNGPGLLIVGMNSMVQPVFEKTIRNVRN